MAMLLLSLFAPAFLLAPAAHVTPASAPRHAAVVAVDPEVVSATSTAVSLNDPQVQAGIAAAVAFLGGGYAMNANKKSDSAPAPPPPAEASPAPAPPPSPKNWPMKGGSGAAHPLAGPWPKTPVREIWTPPPGWKPPTKPVTSWYDRGDRLVAAAPAAAPAPPPAAPPAGPPSLSSMFGNFMASLTGGTSTASSSPKPNRNQKWPMQGGSGAAHPMAGPWPKTPAREQWVPPAGWTPPTKAVPAPAAASGVASWYDTGKRL